MKSLSQDIKQLIAARLDSSSPIELIRIAGAIAANESIEVMTAAYTKPAPLPPLAGPRFVNLDEDGIRASSGHSWVYDRTTGMVWARSVLDGEFSYTDALKACEKVKFMGQACRAPTLQERFGINDYTKHSPALDTEHFKKESGWEWTSTIDAESPSVCAWGVGLGNGYCFRSYRGARYHVRPVLAGQNFSFKF